MSAAIRLFLLGCAIGLLCGCAYHQTLGNVVQIGESQRTGYSHVVTIRGIGTATNPLHPTGQREFEYRIYLVRGVGEIAAKEIVYERHESGISVTNSGADGRMRGSVSLGIKDMTINLEMATFGNNGDVLGYTKCPFNGKYAIERPAKPAERVKASGR